MTNWQITDGRRFLDTLSAVFDRAEFRTDAAIISDIIPVIYHRRGKVREDVQTIYAELGEIGQVFRKSRKRPGERINVKLVQFRVLPPVSSSIHN
jgi:hypothetical protein